MKTISPHIDEPLNAWSSLISDRLYRVLVLKYPTTIAVIRKAVGGRYSLSGHQLGEVITRLRTEKKHGAVLRIRLFVFDHNLDLAENLHLWQRPFLLGTDEETYRKNRRTALRQLKQWIHLHPEDQYLLEGLEEYVPEHPEPDFTPKQVATILGLPPKPKPPKQKKPRKVRPPKPPARERSENPNWPRRYRRRPDGRLEFDPEVLKPGVGKKKKDSDEFDWKDAT